MTRELGPIAAAKARAAARGQAVVRDSRRNTMVPGPAPKNTHTERENNR